MGRSWEGGVNSAEPRLGASNERLGGTVKVTADGKRALGGQVNAAGFDSTEHSSAVLGACEAYACLYV